MLGHELSWRLWTSGRSIAFCTASSLVRAVWRDLPHLLRVPVLMVDDVVHGVAGEGWEGLFAGLERRMSAGLITVATANRGLSELYARHAPLADRFRPGLIVPVAFLWAPPRDGGLLAIRRKPKAKPSTTFSRPPKRRWPMLWRRPGPGLGGSCLTRQTSYAKPRRGPSGSSVGWSVASLRRVGRRGVRHRGV